MMAELDLGGRAYRVLQHLRPRDVHSWYGNLAALMRELGRDGLYLEAEDGRRFAIVEDHEGALDPANLVEVS